jgi:predicted ATPase
MTERMMLESVRFTNFKALRKAVLHLRPFTLLVGPNGSGKTTALQGVCLLRPDTQIQPFQVRFAGAGDADPVGVVAELDSPAGRCILERLGVGFNWRVRSNTDSVHRFALGIRYFSLHPEAMAAPVQLVPGLELQTDGRGLAGVLDRLRDEAPERFEALNQELARWLPEFDRVLFTTPSSGYREIRLRTRVGRHVIAAHDLSQGTLLALAMLALAYSPNPPSVVCIEEPDRGIHPRLLRDVRDALYRLAYPDRYGEDRSPVQVLATTHSPYFLDLYRDRPEEIVIAEKQGLEVRFTRLSDRPDIEDLLRDAHLGDIWYSGILGGVPSE